MLSFIANKNWYRTLENKIPNTRLRHRWLQCGFLLGLCLLTVRLFTLHITDNEFLRKQGNARTLHTIEVPSYRGVITDRRGVPLAVSSPVDAIWINPKQFQPTPEQLYKLASLLDISPEEIFEKQTQYAHKSFVYLKRSLPPALAKQIMQLRIPGIAKKREFKRFYPSGNQVAQLIGFTDIDDVGQAGLELSFDQHLSPKLGKKRVLEDRMGRWIQDIDQFQAPKSGQDIALSIDLRLQSIALRELEAAVQTLQAKSATLVMIDIETGEVLSIVSAPTFNPNNPRERTGPAMRNRALTDQLEPGSTIKAISILSALHSRVFTPETVIDTDPGILQIGDHLVKDIRNYGKLSVKEILEKSSNVGISKITLSLPAKQLIQTFDTLGLGNQILTPFPGEQMGKLPPPPSSPFVHATLAFGYGLAVTPIQLAQAYAIIGAKEIKRPISLIKQPTDAPIKGERVLEASLCDVILEMLTEVVSSGTGKRAKIPGYLTAGKTGTVRLVGPQGYDPNRHIGLFAGISPVKNPKLATVVVVEEADSSNRYYGGLSAAPIYKNVVSQALIVLNIPPDYDSIPTFLVNNQKPTALPTQSSKASERAKHPVSRIS